MPAETNELTHRQKVERLIADLRKQGVNPSIVAPQLFRFMWALGLKVPPPLFLGFFTITLLMGAFFGILWGAAMWLIQWWAWNATPDTAILPAAAAGLLFGLAMAAYYRWKANRLKLPRWENYTEAELGRLEQSAT
ncbi:MAG TPA: DUF6404 family protein [Gemmataceae bacterium]|jgi:hypothetical protein|nr:DUF6404 family protein [Gemmataceae bacterium]